MSVQGQGGLMISEGYGILSLYGFTLVMKGDFRRNLIRKVGPCPTVRSTDALSPKSANICQLRWGSSLAVIIELFFPFYRIVRGDTSCLLHDNSQKFMLATDTPCGDAPWWRKFSCYASLKKNFPFVIVNLKFSVVQNAMVQ